MSIRKDNFIIQLEALVKKLKKESVTLRNGVINISAGHVTGVDENDYSRVTYHHNGEQGVNIEVEIHDSENDNSNEAHFPTLRSPDLIDT